LKWLVLEQKRSVPSFNFIVDIPRHEGRLLWKSAAEHRDDVVEYRTVTKTSPSQATGKRKYTNLTSSRLHQQQGSLDWRRKVWMARLSDSPEPSSYDEARNRRSSGNSLRLANGSGLPRFLTPDNYSQSGIDGASILDWDVVFGVEAGPAHFIGQLQRNFRRAPAFGLHP